MRRPFTKPKTLRDKLETRLEELAGQTEDLRQQVVDRAPVVRDQLIAALPDREQLLDLRDDFYDRLPENVQDRLPEKVKPRPKRLRKVATLGVLTGASAAAFVILKRRKASSEPVAAPAPVAPQAAPAAAAADAPKPAPTPEASDAPGEKTASAPKSAPKKTAAKPATKKAPSNKA